MTGRFLLAGVLLAAIVCTAPSVYAQTPAAPVNLIERGKYRPVAPSSAQVSVAPDPDGRGLVVHIKPGADSYPGITVKPAAAAWDLSTFGHIEARIVNTGAKPISVCLRVDNTGDWQASPWNAENTYLQPGASGTVRVRFGYSWGKPGYALKPAAVTQLLLFTGKAEAEESFRMEAIEAGGVPGEKPPVDPNSIRIKPKDGMLLGSGVRLDGEKQIAVREAKASLVTRDDGQFLEVLLPPAAGEQSVTIRPAVGRWDLSDAVQVAVKVRNMGKAPVRPRVQGVSNRGASDWISTDSPIAAGAEQEVTIPFAGRTIWSGPKETGSQLASDVVSAVTVATDGAETERVLQVESIKAGLGIQKLPDWLGKRPPVEGEWEMTFHDDFDGSAIDASKWNIYGENYWDKQSHFSKDNTVIGDGVVKLRFEKKHGHQNDDSKHQRVTDYATGFLDTYGKWTQRYGYFEARMKLPRAPGLWPAFWMMPDRGADSGPQWKRADTGNGGMEFDIMEHLTRWGPNRYNIAMHWDGYGKEHKSTGCEMVYVQPDDEGFITTGLLWTPGVLVYYGNGREIARWENPRVSNVQADLMFTLPMGGWDNSDLDDTRLPDEFVIDYVRVWQRRDLAAR